MDASKKQVIRWAFFILGPFCLSLWAAWDRNFDAMCGWVSAFGACFMYGLQSLELSDDDEEEDEAVQP